MIKSVEIVKLLMGVELAVCSFVVWMWRKRKFRIWRISLIVLEFGLIGLSIFF